MEKDKNSLFDIGSKKNITSQELEKSKVHIIVEILEYMPNAVVRKPLSRKLQAMSLLPHLPQMKNWLRKNHFITLISR